MPAGWQFVATQGFAVIGRQWGCGWRCSMQRMPPPLAHSCLLGLGIQHMAALSKWLRGAGGHHGRPGGCHVLLCCATVQAPVGDRSAAVNVAAPSAALCALGPA